MNNNNTQKKKTSLRPIGLGGGKNWIVNRMLSIYLNRILKFPAPIQAGPLGNVISVLFIRCHQFNQVDIGCPIYIPL